MRTMTKFSRVIVALLGSGIAACSGAGEMASDEDPGVSSAMEQALVSTTKPLEEPLNVVPETPPKPTITRTPLRRDSARSALVADNLAGGVVAPLRFPGAAFESSTGVLTITGTSAADTVSVSSDGSHVRVQFNGSTTSYTQSTVKEIVFDGSDGDDSFTNSTSVPSTAYGREGNDVLRGGSGDDYLVGGYGQDKLYGNDGKDTLWGSGGSDYLDGGNHADTLFGHGGNDELHGGEGRDVLNGGSGIDKLFGEAGQDLLVSVGGGADTLTGGSQWDNFWLDTTDAIADVSPNEESLGYVHKISKFRSVVYDDGTSVAVGLEPQGEDLPDPKKYPNHAFTLQSFDDHPLFANAGPSKDDIFQGSVGDCYFMARLSAIAKAEPEFIRKTVAPLGDGTYAVRFVRDGKEDYVRVDSDFWATANGALGYADVGQEGSIWVPVIEKAFAIARRDKASYPSINGGNGTTLSNLPITLVGTEINDGLSNVDVLNWFNSGRPSGATSAKIQASVRSLLSTIQAQLAAGVPMATGARSNISDTTPIQLNDPSTPDVDESTYRRGQHIYAIDDVQTDAAGNPTGLVLRDPHGVYRTITDFTRIHFCIGRAGSIQL